MMPQQSSLLFGNIAGEFLPTVSHGQGVHLFDVDGNRYFDGCCGAITANLGHGDPIIADAIRNQAAAVAFAYRGQFTNQPAERLAEIVCDQVHPELQSLFLVSSGSEAVESAAKLARQYWVERGHPERHRILSRVGSYHGATLGALSLSGHPPRRETWEPVLHHEPPLPQPSCFRCPLSLEPATCGLACADEIEAALERQSGEVAAVIVEPVIGAAGGAIAPPVGYLRRVADACQAHGVLLITDEVMTGAWRTGPFLAADHDDVVPDLVTLGKGLASGYSPLAGVLVGGQIRDTIERGSGFFVHGHTHAFNPISAAAGVAALERAIELGVPDNVGPRGEQLRAGLTSLADRYPCIGDVRGRGLLLGIEFIEPGSQRLPFGGAPRGTAAVVNAAKAAGLLIYPSGVGDTTAVIIAPPLTITSSEVDELLDLLDLTLQHLTDT